MKVKIMFFMALLFYVFLLFYFIADNLAGRATSWVEQVILRTDYKSALAGIYFAKRLTYLTEHSHNINVIFSFVLVQIPVDTEYYQ